MIKTIGRLFLVVALVLPITCYADVIVALASGSLVPSTTTYPGTVTNGSFLIAASTFMGSCTTASCMLVGEGIDDVTTWTFNFTGNANYPSFIGPLSAALLTLTLTPKGVQVNNDAVNIVGMANVITPAIQGLPVGVTTDVNLDLLNFYTSSAILGSLSTNAGTLHMRYLDDAVVSSARLELVSSVPEPSYVLLCSGAIAIALWIRRKYSLQL